MKKTVLVLAFTALAAVAMAFPGGYGGQGGYPCYGSGFGGGQGYGPGMMGGRGGYGAPCWQNQQDGDFKAIDDAGAKKVVQDYLAKNLKGFEITDATKFERPMGMVYRFAVKDKNGNQFILMVNPFGYLNGPFPAEQVK